jgi:glycosyltransferase involved in cell wall biosynthesis
MLKRSRPPSPPPLPPDVISGDSSPGSRGNSWTRRWKLKSELQEMLPILISIIIPCKNSSAFLDECMASVLAQGEFIDPRFIEVSIFDDGSSDDSLQILREWEAKLVAHGFGFVLSGQERSGGCGFARNRAVAQSKGKYLCFLDSDDIMLPERCAAQLSACLDQACTSTPCASHRCRTLRAGPPAPTERS